MLIPYHNAMVDADMLTKHVGNSKELLRIIRALGINIAMIDVCGIVSWLLTYSGYAALQSQMHRQYMHDAACALNGLHIQFV